MCRPLDRVSLGELKRRLLLSQATTFFTRQIYTFYHLLLIRSINGTFMQFCQLGICLLYLVICDSSLTICGLVHIILPLTSIVIRIRAVVGQRSLPNLCFTTKSIKIYDPLASPWSVITYRKLKQRICN